VASGALPSYGTPKPTPLAPEPRLTGSAKPRGARAAKKAPGTERVHHPKFGEGVVLTRIGDGAEQKVVIAFADGERTLLANRIRDVE
nr:hypothetical protein [Myxococcota bacterium]